MNNNTWVSLSAPAVIVCGLLSAVLFILNQQYGLAFLAIGLSAGVFGILFGMRDVLSNLAQIHQGMVTFNAEESREFVAAVDSSYGKSSTADDARNRSVSTWEAPAAPVLSAPTATASLGAAELLPAPLQAPPPQFAAQPAYAPEPLPAPKKEAYKPLTGLSLTSPSPSPKPAAENQKPMTAELFTDVSIDGMETTKEFLPPELKVAVPQEQPDAPTIDLAATTAGYEPTAFNSKPSQPLPPPSPASEAKVRAKIVRKRYSTFAGLAFNNESAPQTVTDEEQAHQQPQLDEHSHQHEPQHQREPQQELRQPEDKFEPPPPRKERRRYSTFAGLNLSDRDSRPAAPSRPFEEPKATASAAPPAIKAAPSSGLLSILPKKESSPSPTVPESDYPKLSPAQRKAGRKRYQTFMGLSLSKTPQLIKKAESEPAPTGPLPAELGATAPSASYSAHSDPPSAINKGQLGSLVDGFCSLCGSPQAAGNDYSGATSEPEFCWYCGARLRGK